MICTSARPRQPLRKSASLAKRDWRNGAERVTGDLENGVWYRSPLWPNDDHLLHRLPVAMREGDAYCGRALSYARDWENEELGGLWYTNRKSAGCSECKRREAEFLGD